MENNYTAEELGDMVRHGKHLADCTEREMRVMWRFACAAPPEGSQEWRDRERLRPVYERALAKVRTLRRAS